MLSIEGGANGYMLCCAVDQDAAATLMLVDLPLGSAPHPENHEIKVDINQEILE